MERVEDDEKNNAGDGESQIVADVDLSQDVDEDDLDKTEEMTAPGTAVASADKDDDCRTVNW